MKTRRAAFPKIQCNVLKCSSVWNDVMTLVQTVKEAKGKSSQCLLSQPLYFRWPALSCPCECATPGVCCRVTSMQQHMQGPLVLQQQSKALDIHRRVSLLYTTNLRCIKLVFAGGNSAVKRNPQLSTRPLKTLYKTVYPVGSPNTVWLLGPLVHRGQGTIPSGELRVLPFYSALVLCVPQHRQQGSRRLIE